MNRLSLILPIGVLSAALGICALTGNASDNPAHDSLGDLKAVGSKETVHGRSTGLNSLAQAKTTEFVLAGTSQGDPQSAPPLAKDYERSLKQRLNTELVSQTQTEESGTYAALFDSLGVPEVCVDQLQTHRATIHAKAIIAGEALSDLQRERLAYDKEARALLGVDGYRVYRRFEELKAASREGELLLVYAKAKEVDIPTDLLIEECISSRTCGL